MGWETDHTTGEEFAIMRNSWGNDWGNDGTFKMALVESEEGVCNIYNLGMAVYNVMEKTFFDTAPDWSSYADTKLT